MNISMRKNDDGATRKINERVDIERGEKASDERVNERK